AREVRFDRLDETTRAIAREVTSNGFGAGEHLRLRARFVALEVQDRSKGGEVAAVAGEANLTV
ncbi:MAG: hypothetical protein ACXWP4_22840, partial [Polyangiales bacterium]